MRIPPDISGKLRLLERARADRGLQDLLSTVASSSFGAFPLGTEGETLVVAVPRWADLRLYPLLGAALGRSVRPVPMDADLVLSFIAKVHLAGELPNLHTFLDADFVREENLPLLLRGKVEAVPPPSVEVPADSVALLDLALRSDLANIDRPEGDMRVFPGDLDVPFTRGEEGVSLSPPPPGDEERVLVKMSYVYEGMEHRHGFRSERLAALPMVLHPTELQLVSVGPEGEAGFWIFDAVRPGRAGAGGDLACTYHFLNFGNRYRRSLLLRVLGAEAAPRRALRTAGDGRWTLDDFDRWFGAPF
jgi:hypothetical protein